MADHFKAFVLLYASPFRAIGLILDKGRLSIALVLAIAAGVLMAFPGYYRSLEAQFPPDESGLGAVQPAPGFPFASVFLPLLLLSVIFVPVAVIAVNKLEGTGSAAVVLPRDYMPMLVCHLTAYAAVLIPGTLLQLIPGLSDVVPSAAVLLYFLFLSVCIVRTLSGTGTGRAIATTAISIAFSVGGLYLYSFVSGALYFLASPFVLYYLYIMFGQGLGSQLRGFGGGLSSRQRMRQLLETSTVNPRDADARYQLGLIYQQRRDFTQARKCFEEAIAIDPKEAEPHYQLGRVLRAQGDFKGALEHLKTASAIDNKLAQSEVLRETGATLLDLGRNDEAREVLREFTNRRDFDPEGWYWFGMALSRLRDREGARQAFQQAIEAVRTAPPHRRRQIGQWGSAASKQLRQLP